MTFRLLLLAAITSALLATAACQGIVEGVVSGAVEKATGVRVETKDGGIAVTTKDGETASFGTGRLDPVLQDFPVPSGFTLDAQASGTISTKDGRIANGIWRGSAPPDQVVSFYKQQLPNKGYRELFVATQGTVTQSSWEGQGGRSLILNVAREGNTTVVTAIMTVAN